MVDTFFAGWERVESSLPGYEYLDWGKPFRVAELMVHPGRGEEWRERELAHCQSAAVLAEIKKQNVQLATFAEL